MGARRFPPAWAPEREWAKRAVAEIAFPRPLYLPGLIQAVADHAGRLVSVTEVDAPVVNGHLETRFDGATVICVPTGCRGRQRRFLICRGLARVLYRAPGARDGQLDLTQPLEREIEFAAMALARRLFRARHPRRHT